MKIDTGFGCSFEVIKRNNNIEIENQLAKTETIFTPLGSRLEL